MSLEGRDLNPQPVRTFFSSLSYYIGFGFFLLGAQPQFIISEDRTYTVDVPEHGLVELNQQDLGMSALGIAAVFTIAAILLSPRKS